jgi:sn-glycerol 3-phosphate transport system permease protein
MTTNDSSPPVASTLPLNNTATDDKTVLTALAAWFTKPTTRDLGRALLYASPALVIFILFTYIPFFHAIILSLNITNAQGDAVRFNGFNYYLRILGFDGHAEYLQSILMSFKFALMVVPLSIVVSVALAMLATVRVRGIEFFRTIFTSSIAISLASAGVIWALLYSPSTKATAWLVELLRLDSPSLLGSDLTSLPAVALMTIWTGIGFNFIITLAGVQAIPQDLYESAAIDGAGRWTSFRHITLPLLSPTLFFLTVVNTIGSLQAFTQFHLLLPDKSPNVYVYTTYRTFWYDTRYGFASAMSLVLFVMLLILTVVQYRVLNRRVHYQ